MRIQINQEDIDNGIPGDNHYCPIALAAKRQGLGQEYLTVGIDMMNIDHDYYYLPRMASDFIARFDLGWQSLEPFEFEPIHYTYKQ